MSSRLKFRVRLPDIDSNLHMTNSRYLRMMDLGRLDLALRNGAFAVAWRDRMKPAVVEIDLKFRRELRWRQSYVLDSRLVSISGRALEIEQYFLVEGQVHARAVLKMVLTRGGRVSSVESFRPFLAPALTLQQWKVVGPDGVQDRSQRSLE